MERASTSTSWAAPLETLYKLGAVGSLTDDQLLDRFLDRSDKAASEAAFAALVDRHGPMVLSVCRRIVTEPHDAEDAFQATFLVLARRARSIHGRGTVAAWLFGIARRIAARARVDATRRRRQLEKLHTERLVHYDGAGATQAEEPEPDYSPLIAAVDRLPERLRTPVVLHYFEGIGTEAIAQRLGCPRGTVLSRLARARERLRRRLEHRGFSLEVFLPAASTSGGSFSGASVPTCLFHSTVRAASCLALAGTAIESVVPATVASLSSGVVRNLMFAKARVTSGIVILGVAGVAIGLSMAAPVDEKPAPAGSQTTATKQVSGSQLFGTPKVNENPKGGLVAVRGQVLDPDGKPVASARIVLGLPRMTVQSDWSSPRRLAISGADGRFEVAVPRETLTLSGHGGTDRPVIAAVGPGLGPDWVKLGSPGAGNDLTLRLRRDDVPIEGRITDLEGKPVPNLTVYTALVTDFPAESLERLRETAGGMSGGVLSETYMRAFILAKEGFISPVRTGTDGRFRVTGIGRDRAVLLLIEGESFEQSRVTVCTSSDPAYVPLLMPADSELGERLFGPRFDLTVAPGRVLEGVIRETKTGRPVSGVKVRSGGFMLTTISDAQGRFRITGQPKKPRDIVEFITEGQPYIQAGKSIGDTPGLGPIHVDAALKRGVWVEGKVTNQTDGRPVRAIVQYYPLRDNPHLKACPDASYFDKNLSDDGEFPTDADGKFRAVALPGAGILTVRTIEHDFLIARPLSPDLARNVLHNDNFEHMMKQYQALVPINPDDVEQVTVPNVTVVQGRIQHVQVVGPDGKRVAGTPLVEMTPPGLSGGQLSGSVEFTFVHPEPGKNEPVLIVRQDEAAGAFRVVKGDEPDPIRITLQATATVTGRLIDERGRPRSNVPIVVKGEIERASFEPYGVQPSTGPDGRFRIEGLVPGVSYSVQAVEINSTTHENRFLGWIGKPRSTFKPGETKDWGDVQAKESYPLHPVNPD